MPDPSSAVARASPKEALWRSRSLWLVVVTAIVLGSAAGITLTLAGQAVYKRTGVSAVLTVIALAGVLCVPAAVVWVLQALLRRLWHGGLLTQTKDFLHALWDSISLGVRALATKPTGKSVAAHLATDSQFRSALRRLAELREVAMRLFAATSLTAAALLIIAMTFRLATFLVSFAQVEKLTEQNTLLTLQNRLTVYDQEFQEKMALAESSYRQIADILLSPDSAIPAQVFALQQIPRVMRQEVPRTELSAENEMRRIYGYPNLQRARSLLRQYLVMDRVGYALRADGIAFAAQDQLPARARDVLLALEPVSTQIFFLLHQLGPVDSTRADHCLWKFADLPSDKLPPPNELPAEAPVRFLHHNDRGARTKLGLAHLAPGDFRGIQAPAAFGDARNVEIELPPNAVFDRSHLEFVHLRSTPLDGCSFVQARLEGATLGSLRGANLTEAHLEGADLSDLEGALAVWTHFEGASLGNSSLEGADLSHAHVEKADLSGANLQGANLGSAHFTGADLRGARCENASFYEAFFYGANLSGADLRGTNLTRARFAGANLERADFTGANIGGALLGGAKDHFTADVISDAFGVTLLVAEQIDEALGGGAMLLPGALMADVKVQPKVSFQCLKIEDPMSSVPAPAFMTGIIHKATQAAEAAGTTVSAAVLERLERLKWCPAATLVDVPWDPAEAAELGRFLGRDSMVTVEKEFRVQADDATEPSEPRFSTEYEPCLLDAQTAERFLAVLEAGGLPSERTARLQQTIRASASTDAAKWLERKKWSFESRLQEVKTSLPSQNANAGTNSGVARIPLRRGR